MDKRVNYSLPPSHPCQLPRLFTHLLHSSQYMCYFLFLLFSFNCKFLIHRYSLASSTVS